MPIFFDLNVHAYPETDVPAEVMLRTARNYGYTGIAITNHDDCMGAGERQEKTHSIYTGVEIRTKSESELNRRIKHYYSSKVQLIAVHGGDERINLAALKDNRIDILAHPCGEKGEGTLNRVLVRYAAENGIAIEFNMNAIINNRRGDRTRILTRMHDNLKLVRKYRAMPILTSNACSIYGLRAPREMIAVAALFGMRREEAVAALRDVPLSILEKRWDKEREVELL
ncbi:ribonuclease P protein component 3 [Methanophagales archaeon]|nr:MAG: ribonuclease P protein component 3 [Methanophagales archaeon]